MNRSFLRREIICKIEFPIVKKTEESLSPFHFKPGEGIIDEKLYIDRISFDGPLTMSKVDADITESGKL